MSKNNIHYIINFKNILKISFNNFNEIILNDLFLKYIGLHLLILYSAYKKESNKIFKGYEKKLTIWNPPCKNMAMQEASDYRTH